jgi:phage terminase small subunit
MATPRPLTDKQQAFIREYLVDLNGTQAAIRAGYSPKGANVAANDALTNPIIQAAIAAYRTRKLQSLDATTDRVLLELARLAFSDPRKLFGDDQRMRHPVEWDDDTAAAVSSVEVEDLFGVNADGDREVVGQLKKVKFWSKTAANDMLGKHLRLFLEQKDQGREISELLKSVLLEFQHHRLRQVTPEAEWTPMTPGTPPGLPAPPRPEDAAPPEKEAPQW